jgi:chitinase
VTPPATVERSTFAAYVDVTAWPAHPFETPAGPAQANVILSFIVADASARCTPTWGGYYTLAEASEELELDRRISQLRLTGGDAAVSFGGQLGDELATVCTDAERLYDAYRSVVDRYQLTGIDLDLEGATLSDTAAATRRAEAVARLQADAVADGRALTVWVTLPVASTGLTAEGQAALATLLSSGVDLAGVNGMTMDFGVTTSVEEPLSDVVLQAATALHTQVKDGFARAGQPLGDRAAWTRVGITPMIGQSDVATEQLTLADAEVVNAFARTQGVGLVAMWSLNRDSTCRHPLPTVLSVVQTSCSGIDQGSASFAEVLAADLVGAVTALTGDPDETAAPARVPAASPPTAIVDDPEHSPFPIWDPLGTYPAGTRIVWRQQVYEARYWTSGFAPDTPVDQATDSPWTVLGPVLPGDTPAPLPTLPAGSYPQWDPEQAYLAGTRVQLDLVPYEAKGWTQGQEPGVAIAGGSPWVLVLTGQ